MHLICESGGGIKRSSYQDSRESPHNESHFGVIAMQDISLSYKFASLVSASPTLYLRYGI